MNRININQKSSRMLGFIVAICLAGCSDLVEVGVPKNQLTGKAVFNDSITAAGALANVYVTYEQYISALYPALYVDEIFYPQTSASILEYYQGLVSPDNSNNRNYWSRLYNMVYQCNAVIEQEGVVAPPLRAEAYFLRAYTYLLLQNFFGNIPLILTTDVSVSSQARQIPQDDVYHQIISDLEWAREHLPDPAIGTDNLRANRMAATALLARACLYVGRWEDAMDYSTELIQSPLYWLELPANVFTGSSRETIFQMASQGGAVTGVSSLVPADAGTAPTYPLTEGLYNAFETGDKRQRAWIGTSVVAEAGGDRVYHYGAKYRNRTAGDGVSPEHLVCIRLGEMYLIRAEARAQMDDVAGAIDDINILRERAEITTLNDPINTEACLNLVLEERRRELFLEGPHRFFDLRRFGQLDAVIGAIKPAWQPSGIYFPIPLDELRYNPNLRPNDY